jgi:hypothetical protein
MLPAHKQSSACDASGNAIQLCADTLTLNGEDLVGALGGSAFRHRALSASSGNAGDSVHDRVLTDLLALEERYKMAIRQVQIATAAARKLVDTPPM